MDRKKFIQLSTLTVAGVSIFPKSILANPSSRMNATQLELIHTTDLHLSEAKNLKRFTHLFTNATFSENVQLKLDSGDFLSRYSTEKLTPIDCIKQLEQKKYNFLTLGNQELQLPKFELIELFKDTQLKIVCSDIHEQFESEHFIPNAQVKWNNHKIGIVGITADLNEYTHAGYSKMSAEQKLAALKMNINQLKTDGCDFIVCLNGNGNGNSLEQLNNKKLAELYEIDLVLSGRTHTTNNEYVGIEDPKIINSGYGARGYTQLLLKSEQEKLELVEKSYLQNESTIYF